MQGQYERSTSLDVYGTDRFNIMFYCASSGDVLIKEPCRGNVLSMTDVGLKHLFHFQGNSSDAISRNEGPQNDLNIPDLKL